MQYLCMAFLLVGFFSGESAGRFASMIPYLFAVMTFNSGLGLHVAELRSLRERSWVLPLYLTFLHLVMPGIAWAVASLFYESDVVMGFVLLFMMPVSPSCIVWMAIFRSNVTLAMTLVFVDTLAAPFIIPYALQLFSGTLVELDAMRMFKGLAMMLLAPSLLALVCNRLSDGAVQRKAGKAISLLAKLSIFTILFINGGVTSRFFTGLSWHLVSLAAMTFAFYVFFYAASYLIGRVLFPAREDVIAFMVCLAMRSLTTGMVIATGYFTPVATFIVMLGLFFQQPLTSVFGKVADRFFQNKG